MSVSGGMLWGSVPIDSRDGGVEVARSSLDLNLGKENSEQQNSIQNNFSRLE